jgi:hypothetical protein
MRLSLRALALTFGLLWGGAMLCVGVTNLIAPGYGMDFLKAMSSVYPGFEASRTALDVVVGTVYGLLDGAFGGALLGWLYNTFAGRLGTA